MKITFPSVVTLILGLVGGVLAYLNQASFAFQPPWNQVITFGLYALAVIGISPLVHGAFRSALHVSVTTATSITTLAALLAAGITTFSMGADAKGVLEGILAFLAFVGFAPATAVPMGSVPAVAVPVGAVPLVTPPVGTAVPPAAPVA
jgi:hypothetical protein